MMNKIMYVVVASVIMIYDGDGSNRSSPPCHWSNEIILHLGVQYMPVKTYLSQFSVSSRLIESTMEFGTF
ncbi:MAG: hypothetical protein WAJ93_09970 [Candidatus Nitrosopolaris sp.]